MDGAAHVTRYDFQFCTEEFGDFLQVTCGKVAGAARSAQYGGSQLSRHAH